MIVELLIPKSHGKVFHDISKLSCSQAFRLANFGERDYLDTRGKVLRDIKKLSCSQEFRRANFGLSSYLNAQNKEQPKGIL